MADNNFFIKIGATVDGLLSGISKATKSVSKLDGSFDTTQKKAKSLSSTLGEFKKTGDVFSTLSSSTASFSDKLEVFAENIGNIGSSLKNAFSGSIETVKKFGTSLATSFQQGVLGAKLLKTALITTGIGALLVAVGALIAYWEDIKGFVIGVNGELKRQKDLLEEQIDAQTQTLKLLDASDDTLKLQGKSQIAINNLKIKEIESLVIIKKQLLDNLKTSLEGAVKQEEVYRNLATKLVKYATLPVLSLAKAFDKLLGTDLTAAVFKASQTISGLITPDLTSDLKKQIGDVDLELAKLTNRVSKLKLQNIKLTPRIQVEPIGVDVVAQGLTQGLTVAEGVISEKLESINDKLSEGQLSWLERLSDFNTAASDLISNGISNTFSGIGEAIGGALVNGGNVIQAIGGALLSGIGQIAVELGKSAIAIGVGMIAIKESFKSPFTAIAAGVALVAIGSAIGSIGANATSEIGGGGSYGGASSSSGGGVSTNSVSSTQSSGSFNGRVIFEIAGDKLIGVLNNTSLGNLRVGDSDQLITSG